MFVRWKKTGKHSFAAVLVECKRVGGKPRQKIIKHLATVYDGPKKSYKRGLTTPEQFWCFALAALNELSERLMPKERAMIEWALAERVPRPADDKAWWPLVRPPGRPRGAHNPPDKNGQKPYKSDEGPAGPVIDVVP